MGDDPNEQIDVWEVTPHPDPSYGKAFFCDAGKALAYLHDVAESLVDEISQGETATLTIKQTSMTRHEYHYCETDY